GIGLLKLNVEPLSRCPLAPPFQQCRHIVGRDNLAPAPCRRQCSVTVAGRDVQNPLSGPDVESFAELLADDLKSGADDGVVPGGPSPLLSRFHGRKIDWGWLLLGSNYTRGDVHFCLLRFPRWWT